MLGATTLPRESLDTSPYLQAFLDRYCYFWESIALILGGHCEVIVTWCACVRPWQKLLADHSYLHRVMLVLDGNL